MRPTAHPFFAVALAALIGAAAGCDVAPTFPKEEVGDSVSELLKVDGLQSEAQLVETTLAVHVVAPGSLAQIGERVGVGPAFEDATRKAMGAIHRVLLSTDAEVKFYVVLLSDPRAPGAYLTVVRYVDDIMRLNANMMNVDEFVSRTIFDLNYLEQNKPLTIHQYVPRGIQLTDFLSWQLARRIQQRLTERFQNGEGVADVGKCGGEFRNGEFAFTLSVVPRGTNPTGEPVAPTATMDDVFHTATEVIGDVLGNYEFREFNAVRLIHHQSGQHLVVPKTDLPRRPSAY